MSTTESAVNNDTAREFLDRRELIAAFRRLRRGDFHVRLPDDLAGQDAELAQLFNEVVGLNEQMAQEFQRLSTVVGKEGKITQRGRINNAPGGWENAIQAVNELIDDMVQPDRRRRRDRRGLQRRGRAERPHDQGVRAAGRGRRQGRARSTTAPSCRRRRAPGPPASTRSTP